MSHILLADDEEEILGLLETRLSQAGHQVLKARDAQEIFERINGNRMDLIVLDIMLPNTDGFQIKAQLNQNPSTASIPVIFLSAKDMTVDKIKGLDLGANDYVTKPFDAQELLARINTTLIRKDYYERMSMRDSLTGLGNVTFFNMQLNFFFNMAKRYNRIFSLVLIDLDDFKVVNDQYGHLAGDFILRELARIAQFTLRGSDIISRYGGDEFTIILPDTDLSQTARAMERLKKAIMDAPHIFDRTGEHIAFSISAGFVCYDRLIFQEAAQLFESADHMLYVDKKNKPSLHPPRNGRI